MTRYSPNCLNVGRQRIAKPSSNCAIVRIRETRILVFCVHPRDRPFVCRPYAPSLQKKKKNRKFVPRNRARCLFRAIRYSQRERFKKTGRVQEHRSFRPLSTERIPDPLYRTIVPSYAPVVVGTLSELSPTGRFRRFPATRTTPRSRGVPCCFRTENCRRPQQPTRGSRPLRSRAENSWPAGRKRPFNRLCLCIPRRMLRRVRRPCAQHVRVRVHVQLRDRRRVHRVPHWLEHGARVPHRHVGVRVRPERQSRFAHQRRHNRVRAELRRIPG